MLSHFKENCRRSAEKGILQSIRALFFLSGVSHHPETTVPGSTRRAFEPKAVRQPLKKSRHPFGWRSLCWQYLSSRAVTRKVLSAQMSLTSVFGMGTGGPSPQSLPTHFGGFTPFMSKPFRVSTSLRAFAPLCQKRSRF